MSKTEKKKNKGSPVKLYEDGYVSVGPEELRIKTYYFPTAQSKRVRLADVKAVYWAKQKYDWTETKGWGMSLSPVWWACDMGRKFRGKDSAVRNVVVDNGEGTLKGFSVESVPAFLDALKGRLPSGTLLQDSMPF